MERNSESGGLDLCCTTYHIMSTSQTDVFPLAQNLFQLAHAIKGIVYVSSDFARMGWKAIVP